MALTFPNGNMKLTLTEMSQLIIILVIKIKEMLWLLFENTGKIEYYLKYKELDDGQSRGNSSK